MTPEQIGSLRQPVGGKPQFPEQSGSRLHRPEEQRLQTGMFGSRIVIVGPIQKTAFGNPFGTVRADETRQVFRHCPNESAKLFQQTFIHGNAIIIPQTDQDPAVVGKDIVDRLIRLIMLHQEFEGPADDGRVAERTEDPVDLRMHVARPDDPVAFCAVIQIVLHAKMDGPNCCFPDLVQAGIG